MARRTKVLSGESARKYFRVLFRAELGSGVDASAADRLAETCVREISEMRVRTPLVARRLSGLGGEPGTQLEADANPAPDDASPPAESTPPAAANAPELKPPASPVAVAAAPEPTAPPFDPHAFSLIVVLRRAGKGGLLDKLLAVGDADRLLQIARAQHVGFDAEATDLETLCASIVAGTERRLAHREAAAS
jgi:hypothetical protein